MTPEQYAELNARLSELKTAPEITAFMDDVARRFGDDDPFVNGLGEQAAMIKFALRPDVTTSVADQDDTRELLTAIQSMLEEYGLTLQAWDVGQDAWVLSLARRSLTKQEVIAAAEIQADAVDWITEVVPE